MPLIASAHDHGGEQLEADAAAAGAPMRSQKKICQATAEAKTAMRQRQRPAAGSQTMPGAMSSAAMPM